MLTCGTTTLSVLKPVLQSSTYPYSAYFLHSSPYLYQSLKPEQLCVRVVIIICYKLAMCWVLYLSSPLSQEVVYVNKIMMAIKCIVRER